MSNYAIFNASNNPLYTQSTKTYLIPAIEGSPENDAAKSGRQFILSSGSVAVGGGSSLLLQIANPGGSGKTVYVSSIIGGVTAAVTLNAFKGGTIAGGTTTNFASVPLTAGMYQLQFSGGVVVPENQTLSITLGTTASTSSAIITWWE